MTKSNNEEKKIKKNKLEDKILNVKKSKTKPKRKSKKTERKEKNLNKNELSLMLGANILTKHMNEEEAESYMEYFNKTFEDPGFIKFLKNNDLTKQ